MNRVIIINLNGNAYQLEESGYEMLRVYLDNAARRLEGNPDKAEIVADIEQAIADKFRSVLGPNKTVVITKEVESVIAEMGPVEDGSTEDKGADDAATQSAGTASSPKAAGETAGENESKLPRRLYRIYPEGAMLSGVCNGLAAYFNIDVTIVRLLFVLLFFLWGTGIFFYVLMVIIIPVARTPAEKSAAFGVAATAQEFIRRAKEGYYEGMKTFHDKDAHREWKRKFKQEMRGWKHGFQRQMHEHAHHWQQPWSQQNPMHPRAVIGLGFTLEILKWVKFLLLACGIYAVYALVKYGNVGGLALPAGIPVWIGVPGVVIWVYWPGVAVNSANASSANVRPRPMRRARITVAAPGPG